MPIGLMQIYAPFATKVQRRRKAFLEVGSEQQLQINPAVGLTRISRDLSMHPTVPAWQFQSSPSVPEPPTLTVEKETTSVTRSV
jgi:hypothetical protein